MLERFRPILLSVADPWAKAGESDLVQDSLLEGRQGFGAFHGRRPEEMPGCRRLAVDRLRESIP